MATEKVIEFAVTTGYCASCKNTRFFYQHKDGGKWFCQWCSADLEEKSCGDS